MTGVSIIGALLAAHDPLIAVVPAERQKAGRLPDGIALPAVLVRVVDLIDAQPLKRTGWQRSTARIAVTVRAASYRQQGEVIRLIRRACAHDFIAAIDDLVDVERISVRTAGLGPDVNGPGNSFEQTQDFRVSFDAKA